eukprot:TRINITY_DN39740_c0_g1_i2.p2 TRINITY_DN39740_c0_g1~~TRINITY_DN39740_c0_g1_i2.p2  ORF type:complete len:274 (+),score=81.10 TRINITY_DN39740_c0_g1_i2:58-879(+)
MSLPQTAEQAREERRKEQQMRGEYWLREICSEEEYGAILRWLREEGLDRPDGIDARLERSTYLRELGNEQYRKADYRRALHCGLGCIHYLDFCPEEQLQQSAEERLKVAEALALVLCNVAMIFLKRGDFENAAKVATLGLRCAERMPEDARAPIVVKLLYRRALATAEPGDGLDLEASRKDLLRAARLDPTNGELRRCLENCKALLRGEELPAAASERAPDAAALLDEGGASETGDGSTGGGRRLALLAASLLAVPLLALLAGSGDGLRAILR